MEKKQQQQNIQNLKVKQQRRGVKLKRSIHKRTILLNIFANFPKQILLFESSFT